MTDSSSDDLFRKAAESEGGNPVSAGSRVYHINLAIKEGRGVVFDIGEVPADKRPALLRQVEELVRAASQR